MQSKQSLSKISNYSGLAVSAIVHVAAAYFLLSHNFSEIKIGEQKPIKIALNSFTPVPQTSAPQISEQVMIPEPTPPAPPPPPQPPKPEPKPEPKPNDATPSNEENEHQTSVPTNNAEELPQTGTGNEFAIFGAAASSILAGLGLVIPKKKENE